MSPNSAAALENRIATMAKSGRFPHAILIEGCADEEAAGLSLFAARTALCKGENAPCEICKNCRLVNSGNHPDVSFVYPEDGKKFISVNQIRQLRADAFVKPNTADGKVYIISKAHKMNEQAQNAFLKILEEPPENVYFILSATSKALLLSTVISRCTVFTGFSADTEKNDFSSLAGEYIDLLFAARGYDMLKLLSRFEKDRAGTEEFFAALKSETASRLKSNKLSVIKSRMLTDLYKKTVSYSELLKTNVNLSLLFSAMVFGN